MSRKRNDRRSIRQEEAIERQNTRNSLTPAQQIEHLDNILGEGKGAKKERARLEHLIKNPPKKTKATKKKKPKGD